MECPTTACFNLLDEPTFFKLGRKIAIVFIGSFIISSVVVVEIVSSKVSTCDGPPFMKR